MKQTVSRIAIVAAIIVCLACQSRGSPVLVVSASASASSGPPRASVTQGPRPKRERLGHSIIQLIANPNQYDGANVGVRGYLVLDKVHNDEAEGTLSLDRESARMNITSNAVEVRFGTCERTVSLDPKPSPFGLPRLPGYVHIRGTFEPSPDGYPFGTGAICSVSSVVALQEP